MCLFKNFRYNLDKLSCRFPKITKFYRGGLLKRLIVFLASLTAPAICIMEYYWIGYSFGEGETATGFLAILIGLACIALLAQFPFYFCALGFRSASIGIKNRIQKASDYLDNMTEEEIAERDKNKLDSEKFKPHVIVDTLFGIAELIFALASTIGIIVVPMATSDLFI